jgi:DNA-binding transcriptional ArsR family regulator
MTSDLLTRVRGEIDARLGELRPALAEYERLLAMAGSPAANDASVSAASPRPSRRKAPAADGRGPRGAAQQAIVAALEHGSHTVAELVVVTAMSGASVRESLRRLKAGGVVTTAKREGKAAYALSSPGG